ncbi:hypothetical protein ABZ299_10065 [Streptomyces sp. NPDC006184]|uniref:hypothetical protein n=1 Tax=Streptomyces sp. NPDC006184 TaxID=3155455 RepID=UPI0033A962E2
MATEDEHPSQPDIAAMLTNQTSACKPAREAIAAGAEVRVFDREVPHWMVAGIAAARLRWTRPARGAVPPPCGRAANDGSNGATSLQSSSGTRRFDRSALAAGIMPLEHQASNHGDSLLCLD